MVDQLSEVDLDTATELAGAVLPALGQDSAVEASLVREAEEAVVSHRSELVPPVIPALADLLHKDLDRGPVLERSNTDGVLKNVIHQGNSIIDHVTKGNNANIDPEVRALLDQVRGIIDIASSQLSDPICVISSVVQSTPTQGIVPCANAGVGASTTIARLTPSAIACDSDALLSEDNSNRDSPQTWRDQSQVKPHTDEVATAPSLGQSQGLPPSAPVSDLPRSDLPAPPGAPSYTVPVIGDTGVPNIPQGYSSWYPFESSRKTQSTSPEYTGYPIERGTSHVLFMYGYLSMFSSMSMPTLLSTLLISMAIIRPNSRNTGIEKQSETLTTSSDIGGVGNYKECVEKNRMKNSIPSSIGNSEILTTSRKWSLQWTRGLQMRRVFEWLVLPSDRDASPDCAVRSRMALLPLR